MSYSLDVDALAKEQIAALPAAALLGLAEAFGMLHLVPWNNRSANPDNPRGAVRMMTFAGFGVIEYLILEDRRRVDVLRIAWAG